MADMTTFTRSKASLAAGAAAILAIGAIGGAGAVKATRPAAVMAPTVATAIAKLPASDGVVTVKGRVAEVYGSRFVVQDASGRAMVDAGREAPAMTAGAPVMVQGRYDDGQLRASYLVDPNGRVEAVGPVGRHGPGPGPGPRGDGPDGPGHGGPGVPPPPGCGPAGGPGVAPLTAKDGAPVSPPAGKPVA